MSINPTKWLSLIDFTYEIGDVPVTFDVNAHLSVHVRKLIDGWLTDLLGTTIVEQLNQELIDNPEAELASLSVLANTYLPDALSLLANAAWSRYILHGNVNITNTGPISKVDNVTEGISDRQRTELSRSYLAEAERYAGKLATLARAGSGVCSDSTHAGRTSISIVTGRKRSRFA